MNPIGQPERETQERVIKLFRDELGYHYHGDWSDRKNSNIEQEFLVQFLLRSGYTPPQISKAVYELRKEADHPIRVFAIAKLPWIKQQQAKLRGQERETPREYLPRESHYVWGRRYLLKIQEKEAPPRIELIGNRMQLQIRSGATEEKRQLIVEEWYRDRLKEAVALLISKWEPILKVSVRGVVIRKMKTKWGSCSPGPRTIRINFDLAKKPKECLEYIVVHEMVHLLEPTHNKRFVALMDRFMPNWGQHRATLNRLPVRHETWVY